MRCRACCLGLIKLIGRSAKVSSSQLFWILSLKWGQYVKGKMTGLPQPLTGQSVFGMPIEELYQDENQVPVFLPLVCSVISRLAATEGLFRQCGNSVVVQELGILLAHRNVAMPPCAGVHDCCSFIKAWIGKLPVLLIDPAVFNKHFDPERPDSIRIILQNISAQARKSLACIFGLVAVLLEHQTENRMNFGNIAFCLFNALTKQSAGFNPQFPPMYFYCNATLMLRDDGTDFNLDEELKEGFLMPGEGDSISLSGHR